MLGYGDRFFVETMSFKGLAKKAKRQEPKPGEREKRRKRYGKSVGNKAPAFFLNILEKKVQDKGGQFHRIDTWSAKASQYDHTDMSCKKKDIGERWALLSDGHRIQRDLYSAYLLKTPYLRPPQESGPAKIAVSGLTVCALYDTIKM